MNDSSGDQVGHCQLSFSKFRGGQLEIVTPTKTEKRQIIDYRLFTFWSGKSSHMCFVGERSLKPLNSIARKEANKQTDGRKKDKEQKKTSTTWNDTTHSTKHWNRKPPWLIIDRCPDWYLILPIPNSRTFFTREIRSGPTVVTNSKPTFGAKQQCRLRDSKFCCNPTSSSFHAVHLCRESDFPVVQIELTWIVCEHHPHKGRGIGTREELLMDVCTWHGEHIVSI